MIRTTLLCLPLISALAVSAFADGEVDHYEGEASETLEQALENLANYNDEIRSLLANDSLSNHDMEDIHQATYTLEQAVQRIQTSMEEVAVALEEVHLASEGDDAEALRNLADTYLEMLAPLEASLE